MSPEAAAAAVQEEVKNRVEQTKRQVDAKMMQGANELRNAALTVLANPSPSAPGSPPGVRSGNLRRNWNMYSSGGGGNGIFGIQSGMHYSGYLEHGTSKMAESPVLMFTGVIEGRNGSQERVTYRECILSGDSDIQNVATGDVLKRSFALHCNGKVENKSKLTI